MAMAEQRLTDEIPSDQAALVKPPLKLKAQAEWLVLTLCATSFGAYLYLSKAAATYAHLYLTMWQKLQTLIGG